MLFSFLILQQHGGNMLMSCFAIVVFDLAVTSVTLCFAFVFFDLAVTSFTLRFAVFLLGVCVCACVRARARACVRACVWEGGWFLYH